MAEKMLGKEAERKTTRKLNFIDSNCVDGMCCVVLVLTGKYLLILISFSLLPSRTRSLFL